MIFVYLVLNLFFCERELIFFWDCVIGVVNVLYFFDDDGDFEYFVDMFLFGLMKFIDEVVIEDVGVDKLFLLFLNVLLLIGEDKVYIGIVFVIFLGNVFWDVFFCRLFF